MTTQHIGAAGELLVQYRLLKLGIDSARLTTDAGCVWLFTIAEARELAQQHSPKGIRKLYWFVEPPIGGAAGARHEGQMTQFLLEARALQLFPH